MLAIFPAILDFELRDVLIDATNGELISVRNSRECAFSAGEDGQRHACAVLLNFEINARVVDNGCTAAIALIERDEGRSVRGGLN